MTKKIKSEHEKLFEQGKRMCRMCNRKAWKEANCNPDGSLKAKEGKTEDSTSRGFDITPRRKV